MSCGIWGDAGLRRGLWLHGPTAAGQLAPSLPKAFSCAWPSEQKRKRGQMLFPVPTDFLLLSFKLLYICTHRFCTDHCYRGLYYIFKGEKRLHVKLPNQILAQIVKTDAKVGKLHLNGWDVEGKNPMQMSPVCSMEFFNSVSFAWSFWCCYLFVWLFVFFFETGSL